MIIIGKIILIEINRITKTLTPKRQARRRKQIKNSVEEPVQKYG